jgi:hypothetical protein
MSGSEAGDRDDEHLAEPHSAAQEVGPPGRRGSPFEAIENPVHTWIAGFQTQEQAIAALEDWIPRVMDLDPRAPAYDPLPWNLAWLAKAYFATDDKHTVPRLKALAALFSDEMDSMTVVLEYAMRFGVSFEIYSKLQDAGEHRNMQLSPLALNTLPAMYDLGYSDQVMTWAGNSDAAQYGIYLGSIFTLLQRPNAVAFIAMGGVCKYVAELFAPDLAYRFAQGPSEQVSEFGKGKTARLIINGQSTLCITDQVSPIEIAMLLGHVKAKNSEQERSLWPSPAILECHSLHFRGYLSEGAYKQLEYLRHRIVVEKIYDWKSKAEWKAFLRGGSKEENAPRVVPAKSDFEDGWKILDKSFPLDWQHTPIGDIVLPERFEPLRTGTGGAL